MAEHDGSARLRYSVSLVTQGRHKFYTLTVPSDVLARTCFVSTRDEDPIQGFQRLLDRSRAAEIANYIDNGLGTIPNAIVLSAQPDAKFRVVGSSKTVEFEPSPRAFLIIDGQHRVYGFTLAKTRLRVPVVIYNGLTRMEEARLFIDINTKQRMVPNELLLDIKKLAETGNDTEKLFGEVYDLFNTEPDSPLLGLLSPTSRASGKISRVTFNAAVKPVVSALENVDAARAYEVLKEYMRACKLGCEELEAGQAMTNPTVFRAFMLLFPEIAQRVQDRFGATFTVDNFADVMTAIFARTRASTLLRPVRSHRDLSESLAKILRQSFTLGAST